MNVPSSIGVIIDGNRRWAKERGLPTLEGHKIGLSVKVKELARWCQEIGIDTAYVYAFSTENWNRDPVEVAYLMDLFRDAFRKELKELSEEGHRLRFIGQRERLSEDLQKLMHNAETDTAKNTGTLLVFCISYGGQAEIVAATNALIQSNASTVDEKQFRNALWSAGIPDPDLIIRTGGEKRLSNFLSYEAAYAELFFTDTKWPDFSREEFDAILKEFSERERRHGR